MLAPHCLLSVGGQEMDCNRSGDRADVVGDWRVAVWRQLNSDCPFHWSGLPMPRGRVFYPCAPTYVPLPSLGKLTLTLGPIALDRRTRIEVNRGGQVELDINC